MAISAFSGPAIVFGQNPTQPADYNPDLGTSLFWGGAAILDPRAAYTYLPGESQAAPDFGWLGFDNITTQSIVPYTKATGAIVASANATSATLTLVSANSATTGVYITSSLVRADTATVDAGPLVALDSYTSVTASFSNGVMTITANSAMPVSSGMVVLATTGTVSQGTAAGTQVLGQLTAGTGGQGVAGTYQMSGNLTATSGTVTLAYQTPAQCAVPNNFATPGIYLWNPQAMYGRAVAVTAAASATATTATVSGYDVYGFPMVEAITLTAGSQVSGKKAFKYIKSVVLNAADATHAYSVDTTDVFGLPLRSDNFGDILVNYAAGSMTAITAITAATGYLPSDRTVATSTTGDVRGTFSAFTSSTGANKLVIRQSPQAYMVGSANPGLFGVTQYSNF